MSCKNHMKKSCNCKKVTEGCKNITLMYPNTYTPEDSLANLNTLDKVYNGLKSALIHYLNNVSHLYMNLAEAQQPNKLSLIQNLERFNILQQGFLNEVKTTCESKFTDMVNAVPCVVSHDSIEKFSKKDGNTPLDYFSNTKSISSKRLFTKFSDGTTIEFIAVPSLLFNFDKFNDSLSLKISEPSNNLLSSNSFFRGSDQTSCLFINADTNDGYLYKDSVGSYHPDRTDSYNVDSSIKNSVASVLEFYESIINIGNHQEIGHPNGDQYISGSDIHLFLNSLDIQLKKTALARRMICVRTATN